MRSPTDLLRMTAVRASGVATGWLSMATTRSLFLGSAPARRPASAAGLSGETDRTRTPWTVPAFSAEPRMPSQGAGGTALTGVVRRNWRRASTGTPKAVGVQGPFSAGTQARPRMAMTPPASSMTGLPNSLGPTLVGTS